MKQGESGVGSRAQVSPPPRPTGATPRNAVAGLSGARPAHTNNLHRRLPLPRHIVGGLDTPTEPASALPATARLMAAVYDVVAPGPSTEAFARVGSLMDGRPRGGACDLTDRPAHIRAPHRDGPGDVFVDDSRNAVKPAGWCPQRRVRRSPPSQRHRAVHLNPPRRARHKRSPARELERVRQTSPCPHRDAIAEQVAEQDGARRVAADLPHGEGSAPTNHLPSRALPENHQRIDFALCSRESRTTPLLNSNKANPPPAPVLGAVHNLAARFDHPAGARVLLTGDDTRGP